MSTFQTSKGRSVSHCHVVPGNPCNLHKVSAQKVIDARDWMHRHFPGTDEVRPATSEYNCFGFGLANSHGWFLSAEEFFSDDFFSVPIDDPQEDDVAVYFKNAVLTHVARVREVSGGQITKLQSKWGAMPEVIHKPTEVPEVYGTITQLLRPN